MGTSKIFQNSNQLQSGSYFCQEFDTNGITRKHLQSILLSNLAYLTTPRKGDKFEDPIQFSNT